jgi:SpoVK/Ycf46/Vps4 family AAA+-type ATPase
MSFLADKKREHEAAAEAAANSRDFAGAAFHVAKAAELGLKLAEQSEGTIAARYVDDAFDLIELAETLSAKAESLPKTPAQRLVKEKSNGSPEDEEGPRSFLMRERPTTRLDDVSGLEDVKAVLREKVILPFERPDLFHRFHADSGAGVLMYGPPGNGKTLVAKAIAGEVDAAFFPVNLSEIKSKYVGETAKNLTRLFEEARACERAVIFLDEVDSLLPARGNRKVDSVAQFLMLTDGIQSGKNCLLVLAATNKPWLLDPAVLREKRLGTRIYVGLPDATARESILRSNFENVPIGSDGQFAELAKQTENYSGADLAAVCDRAKMSAIRRQLESGKDESVEAADFSLALEKVKPTITARQIREFETWRDGGAVASGGDEDE